MLVPRSDIQAKNTIIIQILLCALLGIPKKYIELLHFKDDKINYDLWHSQGGRRCPKERSITFRKSQAQLPTA